MTDASATTTVRDRSTTPDSVRTGIEDDNAGAGIDPGDDVDALAADEAARQDRIDKATAGVNEILLTRAIHFYPGGPSQQCYAGVVTDVSADGRIAAVVFPKSTYDAIPRTGSTPGQAVTLTQLTVDAPNEVDPNPTAHLSRDCPFGR